MDLVCVATTLRILLALGFSSHTGVLDSQELVTRAVSVYGRPRTLCMCLLKHESVKQVWR
jgi:hypothetical protein